LIDVRVLAMRPHPDQATHNPGCWAVQFGIRYKNTVRKFWRWHNVIKLNANGGYVEPDDQPPTADEVLARFWDDTFGDLHGFDFETHFTPEQEDAPKPHAYLSAGDTAYASGDRPHTGCFICGRSRSEHAA
jgi:hypothetical protein